MVPFGMVITIGFLFYITWMRLSVSKMGSSSSTTYSQFDVFRDMQPEDQTRVNPWAGFLQEDVYKDKYGPIGDFEGNPDKGQMYDFDTSDFLEVMRATDVPSCKGIEKDLSAMSKADMDEAQTQCLKDITSLQG